MRTRAALLLALAVVLVAGVLGVQFANGGGSFEPRPAADPCAPRKVSSVASGIDGLGERLVLLGLDGAACRLHVTREAFVLDMATPGSRSTAQIDALRAGLHDAVRRMRADHTLPKVSSLAGEAVKDQSVLVKFAVKALPDSLIDAALKTDDVLNRTIDDLDLRALLGNLEDPDAVNRQIQGAVKKAVKDALISRLRDLLP